MKFFIKNFLIVLFLAAAFASCDKANDLAVAPNGNAVTLASSASTLAPVPADSNNVAMTFTWTTPKYAQDPSLYKYVIQLDSAGRNFHSSLTSCQ